MTATAKKTTRKKSAKITKKVVLLKTVKKKKRFFYAVGRRKTAVAKVWLNFGHGTIMVNHRLLKNYFTWPVLRFKIREPLKLIGQYKKFDLEIVVSGSGLNAQAEAIRHGVTRALLKFNPDFRKKLKKAGFLKRDPRKKERKKPGLKRARRAPQFSKR